MLKHTTCLLLIYITSITCVNLDEKHAIIYGDPHTPTIIYPFRRCYFGYSSVLYPNATLTSSWIQIGAPRGEDNSIPGEKQGVVLRCDLTKPCEKLEIDRENGDGNVHKMYYTDKKDNAWIGGSMDIDVKGNQVVTCGFRWTNINRMPRGDFWATQGACYLSNLLDNSKRFRKILPLINANKYVKKVTHLSNSRKIEYHFFNYALGQSGFAVHFVRQPHGLELYFGAPGVLNWGGSSGLFRSLRNTTWRDVTMSEKERPNHNLYGYAVTSGRFFNESRALYVHSSPKDEHYMGTIEIIDFLPFTSNVFRTIDTKKGELMGEYYGHSLAAGDINGDGLDDLVVGAPHFYNAAQDLYNLGRIYIYLGNENDRTLVKPPIHTIDGRKAGGQYGFAVRFLGDFDRDGFGDVAVGAPFEDHSGVVYIYRGSSEGLLPDPAQIIYGKVIERNLKGFGGSFSNPADIDNNGFLDLAIGAYLSDNVVVLRARKIIYLVQNFNATTKTFDAGNTRIRHCIAYYGHHLPEYIEVEREVIIDDGYFRVELENATQMKSIIRINETQNYCDFINLRGKDAISNILDPLKISVKISVIDRNNDTNHFYVEDAINHNDTFCTDCAIVRNNPTTSMEVPFSLNCGDDEYCLSDLSLTAGFSKTLVNDTFIIGSRDYINLDLSIYNRGENAYETKILVALPPKVSSRLTPPFCSENVNTQIITCMVANPLPPNARKFVQIRLNMINVNYEMEELKFRVWTQTSSGNKAAKASNEFPLKLQYDGGLRMKGKANLDVIDFQNNFKSLVNFSHTYQIYKFGKSPVNSLHLDVHLPYLLKSYNTKFLKIATVIGSLAGQPLTCVNLTDIEYIQSYDIGTNFKIDELAPTIDDNVRNKRAVSYDDADVIYTNNLNRTDDDQFNVDIVNQLQSGIANVDCDLELYECALIRCRIPQMGSETEPAVIQIRAQINLTMFEYLNLFNESQPKIQYTSYASLLLNDKSPIRIDNDIINVTSLFHQLPKKQNKTWIIIVAIVAGLLIFWILLAFLQKLGFFERKSKKDLEELIKEEVIEEYMHNIQMMQENGDICGGSDSKNKDTEC